MYLWSNILRVSRLTPSVFARNITLSSQQLQNERPKSKNPLMLMDTPRILIPNIFELIKIRLRIKFRMMQIDPEFNYSEFSKGTLQAVVTISNMISKGEFNGLKGLVHDSAIEKVKQNYELLDANQKSVLAVNPSDVQVQVHYLFEEAKADSSLFVKMGLLFYVVPGFFEAMQQAMLDPIKQMDIRRKFQDDLIVADYRLVREYSQKGPSEWIITELNHWAVADHEEFRNKK